MSRNKILSCPLRIQNPFVASRIVECGKLGNSRAVHMAIWTLDPCSMRQRYIYIYMYIWMNICIDTSLRLHVARSKWVLNSHSTMYIHTHTRFLSLSFFLCTFGATTKSLSCEFQNAMPERILHISRSENQWKQIQYQQVIEWLGQINVLILCARCDGKHYIWNIDNR